jgi:hypothetical protein
MKREEILLKEYEACQQDNQARASRYWVILGIFVSINAPILGGLWVLSNTDIINEITNATSFLIKLPFLFIILCGIFTITKFLELSLNRSYFIIQNNNRHMLEIEIELGMWKELPIYVLDKWNKIRKRLKYKTKPSESQNNEIWECVWKELPKELSKVDILQKDKSKIEAILQQNHGLYSHRMEYKATYVFWGIFSLWAILIAYLLTLASPTSFKNWSLLYYLPVLIGIAWDYCYIWKKEHSS